MKSLILFLVLTCLMCCVSLKKSHISDNCLSNAVDYLKKRDVINKHSNIYNKPVQLSFTSFYYTIDSLDNIKAIELLAKEEEKSEYKDIFKLYKNEKYNIFFSNKLNNCFLIEVVENLNETKLFLFKFDTNCQILQVLEEKKHYENFQ